MLRQEPPRRRRLWALARAFTLLPVHAVAFVLVNLGFETAGRVWGLPGKAREPAVRRERFNALVRGWGLTLYRLTRWAFGFELEIAGTIPPGNHVIISNHQSTADIAILIHVFRDRNCKFAVKRQLSRFIPSVSTASRHGGFAVLGREKSRSDLIALREMGAGLAASNASAILFVEGTRSRTGAVLPYHRSAARVVAEASGLPLLPVAIDGTWRARNLFTFPIGMPGRTFRVTIGEPVDPRACEGGIAGALEGIRRWTIETLASAGQHAPGEPATDPA